MLISYSGMVTKNGGEFINIKVNVKQDSSNVYFRSPFAELMFYFMFYNMPLAKWFWNIQVFCVLTGISILII